MMNIKTGEILSGKVDRSAKKIDVDLFLNHCENKIEIEQNPAIKDYKFEKPYSARELLFLTTIEHVICPTCGLRIDLPFGLRAKNNK